METKRFIGNDLPRLYARIRRDIGPEAVIVRTRSLLREGAEPLIEILAAPDDGSSGLPPELQQAMHNTVLGRVDPSMTVGDLEDIIARDHRGAAPAGVATGYASDEPGGEPEWTPPGWQDSDQEVTGPDGFNEGQLIDQLAAELERRADENPDLQVPPAFARLAQERREAGDEEPTIGRDDVQRDSPMLETLVQAGLSRYAAECAVELATPGADIPATVGQAVAAGRAEFPAEDETTVVSVQGIAGSGRTTALLRMALDCHEAGRKCVVALVGKPPGNVVEYTRQFARWAGIEFQHFADSGKAGRFARKAKTGTCIFLDVPAGVWRMSLPVGVRHYRYLAVPGVMPVDDLREALDGFDPRAFSGLVPTAMDAASDARAVLTIALETGLGLAFLASGADPATGITVADPFTLASGSFTTPTGGQTDGRLTAIA